MNACCAAPIDFSSCIMERLSLSARARGSGRAPRARRLNLKGSHTLERFAPTPRGPSWKKLKLRQSRRERSAAFPPGRRGRRRGAPRIIQFIFELVDLLPLALVVLTMAVALAFSTRVAAARFVFLMFEFRDRVRAPARLHAPVLRRTDRSRGGNCGARATQVETRVGRPATSEPMGAS